MEIARNSSILSSTLQVEILDDTYPGKIFTYKTAKTFNVNVIEVRGEEETNR